MQRPTNNDDDDSTESRILFEWAMAWSGVTPSDGEREVETDRQDDRSGRRWRVMTQTHLCTVAIYVTYLFGLNALLDASNGMIKRQILSSKTLLLTAPSREMDCDMSLLHMRSTVSQETDVASSCLARIDCYVGQS